MTSDATDLFAESANKYTPAMMLCRCLCGVKTSSAPLPPDSMGLDKLQDME